MRIVISGASGFLGAPLTSQLRDRGHEVITLVRSAPTDDSSVQWDPVNQRVDPSLIASADAVINLSGAPISQWPRTSGRAKEILRSRVSATSTLARSIATADKPPAFLSGSGMSWYGVNVGQVELTESSDPGSGFLAKVAQAWEKAADPAVAAGSRVAYLRTSVVLDRSGGALKLMRLPFSLGLGAQLGNGKQRFSIISRRDWIDAVVFATENALAGPINLSAPKTPTNAQFTAALAAQLGRPVVLTAPQFAIRAALGGLADDLLGSLNVKPKALLDAGFGFSDPDVEAVLATGLA